MAEALAGAGYVVQTYGEWLRTATMTGAWSGDVVREFPWGLTLEPERRFRADFAFPRKGLLLEIEGGAHGVQKQRKHDVLRDQLAQQAGYKVLRVLPEQVMRDGGRAALDAVRLTLNERATAPIERDALLWVDVPEPVNGGTWWVRALRTVEEAFWPVPERLTAAEVLRALMHRPHDFLNQKNYAKVSHERLIEHLKEALALVRAAVKGGA